MRLIGLAPAALALGLALAGALGSSGCYAFTKHEAPEGSLEADSTSMAVDVDNRSAQTVRVLAGRNGQMMWIGTVSAQSQRRLFVPAAFPTGGSLTFAVTGLGGTAQWTASGILPRAGATLRLDLDPDLRMSTWSME